MSSNEPGAPQQAAYAQLVQVSASIDEASEIFASNDPAAPMPIVVVPRYGNRFFNVLLFAAILAAIGAVAIWVWAESGLGAAAAGLVALLLAFLGVRWMLSVSIPEGMHALLSHGGKYKETVGAGYHTLLPWIRVSHLVTARAIPYAVLVRQAPTADFVRADVDATITFVVEDASRFVFKTSTGAFDEILQASCQDALRATVRRRPVAEINDIDVSERDEMRRRVATDVEGYGVSITNVNITHARLPELFMESQEARQLAILQQAEQAEQQTLALRRQTDREVLARQEVLAEVERKREILRGEALQAEARRQVAEMDAETVRQYPEAVQLQMMRMRMEIGKALAANSRAIVRVGGVNDFEQIIRLDAADSAQPAAEAVFLADQ